MVAASLAGCRSEPAPYVLASQTAPDGTRVAMVRLVRCDSMWCEGLWLGPDADTAQLVATLRPGVERCTEIAWTRVGHRAGFLVNGRQLRVYDAGTNAPAGMVDLIPSDAQHADRTARGVTFSVNGAAITFDDCPRDRSGCRSGIVAVR